MTNERVYFVVLRLKDFDSNCHTWSFIFLTISGSTVDRLSIKHKGFTFKGPWKIVSLPFYNDQVNHLASISPIYTTEPKSESPLQSKLPMLFEAELETNDPVDTHILMKDWGKGVVFVNGQNLGRYWMTAEPQNTLYLPGAWLKSGINRIQWFEESKIGNEIEFKTTPDLGERSEWVA